MAFRPLVPLALLASAALLAPSLLPGCTGAVDGPVSRRPAHCDAEAIPAAHPLRRLTADQYQTMIARMFPGVTVALSDLPDGVVTGYGYSNDARLAEPTPTVIDGYHAAAETVAAAAIASPGWIGCDVASADCIEATVLSLAETAFRHALDEEQRAILLDLVRTELAVDAPLPTLELAIQVILESPEFLYFPESGSDDVDVYKRQAPRCSRKAASAWRSASTEAKRSLGSRCIARLRMAASSAGTPSGISGSDAAIATTSCPSVSPQWGAWPTTTS